MVSRISPPRYTAQRYCPILMISLCFAVAVACDSSSTQGDGAPAAASADTGDGNTRTPPNVLLIIADDQGVDASAQYPVSQDTPTTPVIDGLANQGLTFDNAWATPSCTTTRGSIITGLHGVNSGVDTTPSLLDTSLPTLQKTLGSTDGSSAMATAVIGKWHLAGNTEDLTHPTAAGVDYYAGTLSGTIDDYYNWPLVIDGTTETSTRYHTTALTDLAIDWIGEQSSAWFLQLAYVAPHSPFHLPPADLHSRVLSGDAADIEANPREYFLAAIEAMDSEIGRLLDTFPDDVRRNTLVIYLGDNGTSRAVLDREVFDPSHSKNSLYEGGIRVPLIVSGAGVARENEREAALVNTVDLFPTLTDLTGHSAPAELDGQSFVSLLQTADIESRAFNYSEFNGQQASGWTVRNADVKLIEYTDGRRELFDLTAGLDEQDNLIDGNSVPSDVVEALDAYGASIRTTP